MSIREVPIYASNETKRAIRIANAKLRGSHTKHEWQLLKDYFSHSCVRCGDSNCKLQKDHIIPIYQGGCHCIYNIQPLCARCNSSKGPESEDHRSQGWLEFVNGVAK